MILFIISWVSCFLCSVVGDGTLRGKIFVALVRRAVTSCGQRQLNGVVDAARRTGKMAQLMMGSLWQKLQLVTRLMPAPLCDSDECSWSIPMQSVPPLCVLLRRSLPLFLASRGHNVCPSRPSSCVSLVLACLQALFTVLLHGGEVPIFSVLGFLVCAGCLRARDLVSRVVCPVAGNLRCFQRWGASRSADCQEAEVGLTSDGS